MANGRRDGDQGRDEGRPGGISRRDVLKGGGAGLASAVVLGSSVVSGPTAHAAAGTRLPSGPLTAADPHAGTARTKSRPLAAQVALEGAQLRILPITNAKFLAGAAL